MDFYIRVRRVNVEGRCATANEIEEILVVAPGDVVLLNDC